MDKHDLPERVSGEPYQLAHLVNHSVGIPVAVKETRQVRGSIGLAPVHKPLVGAKR